ncbi:MAG: ATP-dependent Clp protease proteolytic subunit [Clostridiales bacterium]
MFWKWKNKSNEKNKLLIETRKIILENIINEKKATEIVKNMVLLEEDSVTQDINLYLRENKSSISSIFTIHDNIKHIKATVATYAEGNISGLSAVLLSSGMKGKRFAYRDSTIKLLPVTKLSENLENEDEAYLVSMKRKIYELLCKNTNQPYYKVENDCENSILLNANESKQYGLIDNII